MLGNRRNLRSPGLTEALLRSPKAGKDKEGPNGESLFESESDDGKGKERGDAAGEPTGFAQAMTPSGWVPGAADSRGEALFAPKRGDSDAAGLCRRKRQLGRILKG